MLGLVEWGSKPFVRPEPNLRAALGVRQQCLTLLLLAAASCSSWQSPLVDAVKARDTARIETLLAAGASDAEKVEALKHAAVGGYITAARLLLEAGADPDAALTYAISGRSIEAVRLMLDAGGDPSDPVALSVAVAPGSEVSVLGLLLERAGDRITQRRLDELLHKAAGYGKAVTVSYLLSRGANPNSIVESSGRTVIDHARESKNWDAVEVLMRATREKPH